MVEFYYNENNEKLKTGKATPQELIWNYHVWTEVWMAREDLNDSQYDGWQVIDGTPSTLSDGIFQKGPASVAAVRKGEVKLNYDVDFVLAEVNADKVDWLYRDKDKSYRVINVDTTMVGKKISTKAVGFQEREDVTSNYKPEEGSMEEDALMHKAWLETGIELPHLEHQSEKGSDDEPLSFSFKEQDNMILLGQSFSVELMVENLAKSQKKQTVTIMMTMDATDYTRRVLGMIKSAIFTEDIDSEQTFALNATYEEYENVLGSTGDVRVRALVHIPDLDYYRPLEQKLRLTKPPLLMMISGSEERGVEMNVNVRFQNTLSRPLTKGYFKLNSPGINNGNHIKHNVDGEIAPSGYAQHSFMVMPTRRGKVQINAMFYAPEMGYVVNYQTIDVK